MDEYSFDQAGVFWPELDSNVCCSNGTSDNWKEKIKGTLNAAMWSNGELYISKNKLIKDLVHTNEGTLAEAIKAGWGIDFLLKLLKISNSDVQILACLMLAKSVKFSSEESLKAAVPLLIEQLNCDSFSRGVSLKEVTALVLKRLAKKGDDLRLMMGYFGALPILLNFASQSDGRLQDLVLQVLRELVLFTKMNQDLLVQAGGLRTILNLINSPSVIVKCMASEILGTLASLCRVRRAIANFSGISSLVEAVRVGCMASKTRAAHALGVLAFKQTMRRMIVDAGGIPVLIELLREGDQSAKLVAGSSLGIVSACVDHLSQVAQAGAIPLFISLLEGGNPHGKDIAEDAFCILAVSEENASIIMEHLVRILRNGSVEAKAAAADIVWDLSSYRHSVSVVAMSGALPLLVGLLKDESDEVRENISGAIAQLSYRDDDRQALAEIGVIPILVESLQDQSTDVKENIVEALHNFAQDSCYRDDMLDACAVPALVALRGDLAAGSMFRGISEHAAAALWSLGQDI